MKELLTIRQSDIEPGYNEQSEVDYRIRYAARAVLKDDSGRIALLHSAKRNYYKLPGGGIEQGEDVPTALSRELMEEVGAEADVVAEIGRVDEWRNIAEKGLHQISDAFLARVVGQVGEPYFTKSEIADGFSVVWADDEEEAIRLIESALGSPDPEVRFMATRDATILKASK